MENKLNALSELVEKLVNRIEKARENNNVSKIEVDIMLDLLRHAYLAVEDLQSSEKHTSNDDSGTFKQVVQERRPEIEKVMEEVPVNKPELVEAPSVYATPAINEVPEIKQPVAESVSGFEADDPKELKPTQESVAETVNAFEEPEAEAPQHYNEHVFEINQPAEEPVQPKPVPIDEVPVMSFPKVEVTLDKPSGLNEHVFTPSAHFNPGILPEPEPVRESYSPPPAPVNPVMQTPEVHHTERVSSTHQSQKTSKTAGDLFAPQTIADKLRTEKQSLNEKITQGRTDQSLGHKMQLKPISDLRTAIGINEKFQFVNDLFEGRIDLYNDAIAELNSCGSVIIAERLVDELKSRHNWTDNAEAYGKLKTFVTRRYL